MKRHEAYNQTIKNHQDAQLLFIGDSITDAWSGPGKEAWNKHFAPRKAVNLGIGGDRTQHVLWRLENGNIDGVKPKAAVLMIGTNNSNGNDHTAEEIAEGIKAIVAKLRKELPETKILLLAIFPRGEKPNPQREKNAKASKLASEVADGKMVHYLDIGEKFLEPDGSLSKEIMPDRLHLSPKGYQIWAENIEPKVAELVDHK
jgi:lysophospholipase L1-like esterase